MKRAILFIFCSVLSISMGYAQDDSTEKILIRGANDLKTGNSLDVLTNFFQLAVQDLTGDNKSFNFNSTLYAIKLRADSTLDIDTNLRKERFARNLQFELAINLNKDFQFSGFSGGITYAIINNRDKAFANFANEKIRLSDSIFRIELDSLEREFETEELAKIAADKKLTKEEKSKKKRALQMQMAVGHKYYVGNQKADSFPEAFKERLNSTGSIRFKKINTLHQSILTDYDSLMDDIGNKALLTVSLNGKTNRTNGFDNANVEMVYLKGKNVQADVRANLTFKDTATATSDYRLAFNFKGGADITLMRGKRSKKPVLEIKPNLEYNNIFNGVLPGQEKEMFSFNTDIRIRVIDQIWIPVIIKYDIKNQNFLGFLNVTVNMDAFKNFLKTNAKS